MRALSVLTVANIRSFLRDRPALFWTLAFPIVFVVLFGTIFSDNGGSAFKAGWVDEDNTAASQQLRAIFASTQVFDLQDGGLQAELDAMRGGDVTAVIEVPSGYSEVVAKAGAQASLATSRPLPITLSTDPSRSTNAQTIQQIATSIVQAENQILSGQPPQLSVQTKAIQTEQLTGVSYFVPSILGMALVQLGTFAAIPLVQ